MGEVKDSNMELNDFRHGVVPVSKNLVNDMLICSSDYEVLIENSQMIRNPAKLREPSKKEGIISSTDSKSVCSQEVVTDLLPETQSLLNVPNGDLVAVKINGSNVQTNGQGIKESKVAQLPKVGLAFSRSLFQDSLLPASALQILVLKTRRSFSRPSIHPRFSLPLLRVPIG
ncbi:hypothetical protein TNCV_3154911 [Trichonephila clavipes]|nr:hypothetical protein TNCV_3154911 [Trichonephila clavipes]